jgi:hypothetical protein
MYKSHTTIFRGMLLPMLSCFGNKDYEITYYKHLRGYGLNASDFDKQAGCSRRVFSHWKGFLLDKKLIKTAQIKGKSKSDGSFRTPHNTRYIITGLGICYFSSLSDEIGEITSKNMIKFLSESTAYNLHLDWDDLCVLIGCEKVCGILKKVCDSIKISYIGEKTLVNLNYETKGKINYNVYQYIINKRNIVIQHSEEGYGNIDDDLFHKDIAEFIVDTFCYSIIEEYNYKIKEKSRILDWDELQPKEKSNIKKMIKKYQNILENIPFEVHEGANNFFSTYAYPMLNNERKLMNHISEYYRHTIAPKYGLKFADGDGQLKPFTD